MSVEKLEKMSRTAQAMRGQAQKALAEAGPRSQVAHFLTTQIALSDALMRDLGDLLTDELVPAAA